jgi:ATP-binding cassette, subfamily B, bacterial
MRFPQLHNLAVFFGTLFSYVRPYRRKTFLLLFLLLVNLVFSVGWPLSFKYLIDHAIVDKNQRVLIFLLAVLTGGVVVISVAAFFRDYTFAFLSARVLHDVRMRLFERLQQLSMSYYSKTSTGDILAKFSTDLSSLENAVGWAVSFLIFYFFSVLFGTIVLFTLEWRLAFLTLLGLTLCILLPQRYARHAADMNYKVKQKEGQVLQQAHENVLAQPVIKSFGLEDQSIENFRKQSENVAEMALRFHYLSAIVQRLPNVTILMIEILVVGAGALLVFYGYRTLGTLVAFHTLFLHISYSVDGLTKLMPVILRSVGGVRRIEELLNEKPEMIEAENALVSPQLSRSLSFHNVRFSYGSNPVLNEVSFEIPRGKSVAFVGPSGSGKTTVLNLLLRFYDPSDGSISIDDQDLRTLSINSFRSQIGVVFQDSFLFNRTVRENIRLGRLDASIADVEEAAKAAEIHDAICKFPEGYDTLVGERGGRLSGGQRQRIAIARALIRDPEILILDEATSALDPETESMLNLTLEKVAVGRTVISITHRLSTIRQNDRIFVLRQGRLEESGTHASLIEKNGLYAQLWQKQSGFLLNERGDEAKVEPARLRRYPILEKLDDDLLTEMAALFATEIYGADQVVFSEGDTANRFFLIVRGKVSVEKKGELIAGLEDGDCFGEIALIKNVPRNATIRTKTSCVFLSLRRQHFQYLIDTAPHVREILDGIILARSV